MLKSSINAKCIYYEYNKNLYDNIVIMNILYIERLMVMARIGIHDWEKRCLQKLVFDLQLRYESTFIVKKRLDYLNYTQVSRTVLSMVNTAHFLLIEDIAELIVSKLMERFSIINYIRIRVSKPDAILNAGNVGVCLSRRKSNVCNKLDFYMGWK